VIRELYGEEYLSPSPRRYQTKTANAQEAHEAIRPAGDQMRPPTSLPHQGREHALYDLIWKRTVASQMANARLKAAYTATISRGGRPLPRQRAHGALPRLLPRLCGRLRRPGGRAGRARTQPLPPLTVGEQVDCRDLEAVGHETKPPARYTEATLVKALEAEGIGRPSTYATIIDTIQERGYCFKQRKELAPTFTAFAVTELLEEHFDELVDLKFTATMEQQLDDIANGEADYLAICAAFSWARMVWKRRCAAATRRSTRAGQHGGAERPQRRGAHRPVRPLCGEGRERRAAHRQPAARPAARRPDRRAGGRDSAPQAGRPAHIGNDPESELPVLLKGSLWPLRAAWARTTRPARPSPSAPACSSTWRRTASTWRLALALLSLPRTLGEHPETGKPVQAGVGRFGPFVVHDGVFANLKAGDDVLTIDLGRALELFAEKKGGGRTRGASAAKSVLVALGEHPDGGAVQVLDGRYGPYVNWGKVNVTLPKEMKPADVSQEQALAWLAEKAAAGPVKKGAGKKTAAKTTATKTTAAKPATTKKTAAKTTTGKKAAAKKTPAKSTAKKTAAKK
jgi:DNA topoisomerase-1